jgi:hypothetical protein
MTAAEMLVYFRERYNLSSNVNWGKQDDELYLYLNAAVTKYTNTRVSGNNALGSVVNSSVKSNDDLRTLIKTSASLASAGTVVEIVNAITYTLPADYMFGLQAYLEIAATDWVSCDFISHLESRKYTKNSTNDPVIDIPKVIINDETKFTVIFDGSLTPVNAKIVYIKTPNVIGAASNCDLPAHTHYEIVETAVTLAIEGTESPRVQSQPQIERSFQ